jgi:large subunit ribosomal protein L25
MATEIKLEVQSRSEENGKVKKIREAGFIPANVYGSGVDNKNIKVKELDFRRVFGMAGESHLIDLVIDGGEPVKAIVKDTQKSPTKDNVIHIDFYQVDMSKKITTEIPLNFIGESRGVKELGGTLIKNLDSLEVKCLPGNLVDKIDVDLSGLNNFHDAVRANDINLPEGMELISDTNETVVSVIEPVKEEERVEEVEEAAEGEEVKEGEEETPSDAKETPSDAKETPKEESEKKK